MTEIYCLIHSNLPSLTRNLYNSVRWHLRPGLSTNFSFACLHFCLFVRNHHPSSYLLHPRNHPPIATDPPLTNLIRLPFFLTPHLDQDGRSQSSDVRYLPLALAEFLRRRRGDGGQCDGRRTRQRVAAIDYSRQAQQSTLT